MPILLIAIILGIVEGVTEFIPVSSTGHLILATELLGFDADKWAAFNVIIQLGAILAIVVLYWRTFWAVLEGMIKGNPMSWRFVRNILIAFLPSAILGFMLINQIEALLGNAMVVAFALIVGGIAILVIEKLVKRGEIVGVAEMPVKTVVGVGLIQCLAMIPGVSRSGATILGGLSLGVERRTAAEFSFFLAIPTMLGATTLELVKHHDTLMAGASGVGFGTVAVGFVVSFVVAIVVVKAFVHYISRHGFAPFAWYRIVAGAAALAWLTCAEFICVHRRLSAQRIQRLAVMPCVRSSSCFSLLARRQRRRSRTAAADKLPPELTDPRLADRLAGRHAGAVARPCSTCQVGEVQAALEGREPTPAERNLTVRDSAGATTRISSANLRRQVAEAGPAIAQRHEGAQRRAARRSMKALDDAGRAIDRPPQICPIRPIPGGRRSRARR